jgi:hypothetical protein
MDKPMSRVGCLVVSGVWLCVMVVPFLAFLVAMRGEVSWRRGAFVEDRLWLVRLPNEAGRDETRGLAYASVRVVSDQRPVDGPVCVRTRAYFFLWHGTGTNENSDFCECYLAGPQGDYAPGGNCP